MTLVLFDDSKSQEAFDLYDYLSTEFGQAITEGLKKDWSLGYAGLDYVKKNLYSNEQNHFANKINDINDDFPNLLTLKKHLVDTQDAEFVDKIHDFSRVLLALNWLVASAESKNQVWDLPTEGKSKVEQAQRLVEAYFRKHGQ